MIEAVEQSIVKSEQPSVMDMIAHVANGTDVAALEKLVDLQFRILDEQKTAALNAALAQLEPLIEPLAKSKAGARTKEGSVKYYYTPYEATNKMLRPLLKQCGLSLSFSTRQIDGKTYFVGAVQEVSKGGIREAMIPFSPDGNSQLNSVQGIGSGLSYCRRYLVDMLFNLSSDTDDDGAFAGAITAEQVGKIERLITECGESFDGVAFVRFLEQQCGVSEVTLIPKHKFSEIEAALIQKKGKAK